MGHLESEAMANPMNDHESAAMVLAGIARAVVQYPGKVEVHSHAGNDGALLTLYVDPADLERVVGAGGRTARSLQAVLTALGKRNGQRFSLDIQSHGNSSQGRVVKLE